MPNLTDYKRFEKIMTTIMEFDSQIERVNDFFEKELMKDTWCVFTLGDDIQHALTSMLADEYDCWYSRRVDEKPSKWWESKYGASNDIEWWLYEASDEKSISVNGKTYNLTTLPQFYDYLMEQKYDRIAKGEEVEFASNFPKELSVEDSVEIIKGVFEF